MRVGSLCTGIGGLDLGLERAGMTIVWQCEVDPFACAVLAKHWPDVPNLGDLTVIDWCRVEPVDLICAGYPCQPFSLAGSRGGDADPRHLWPFVADAVRHLRPRVVLLENVPGHLSLGFGRVLGDLAALGYDAEWTCVSAGAVGAPHLRIRLFVVAHPVGDALWQQPAGLTERLGAAVADDDGGQRHARRTWTAEPDVGRVADGIPDRVDRLRVLGNAVVPEIAELIGKELASP